MARNLTEYLTLCFCPEKFSEYKKIMESYNKKAIDKLFLLPLSFRNLLKAMLNKKNSCSDILIFIDLCIQEINSFI
jgi:hypothetical protein